MISLIARRAALISRTRATSTLQFPAHQQGQKVLNLNIRNYSTDPSPKALARQKKKEEEEAELLSWEHHSQAPGSLSSELVICHASPENPSIYYLTLNDPSSHNALSLMMLHSLSNHITTLTAEDSSAKVIVIQADGPVFCSGHDLKELRQMMVRF